MYKYIIAVLFCCLIQSLFGQQVVVYGRISDVKTGNAIPFAKIQFNKSKKATLSDSLGNYQIVLTEKNDSITCSYIGYAIKSYKNLEIQTSHSVGEIRLNIDFQLKTSI